MSRGKNSSVLYSPSTVVGTQMTEFRSLGQETESVSASMRMYMNEKDRHQIKHSMIYGYQEMAAINLTIACEGLCLEEEVQALLEKAFGE